MAETTTTTTTVKPEDDEKEVRKGAGEEASASGNSSDNTNVPTREESLEAASEASPHADGDHDDTQVLGSEGQSAQDRLDSSRREALQNSEGEQDLSA